MSQEKSAGAVIFYKRGRKIEYLLLHYGAGHWDFPKGHIEEGEDLFDTVRREVKEETSLQDITIIPGFKEHISYFYRRPKEWRSGSHRVVKPAKGAIFKIVTFFLTRSRTKKVKLSFEHIGYRWLPYHEAKKQLTFKNAKEILEKANDLILRDLIS